METSEKRIRRYEALRQIALDTIYSIQVEMAKLPEDYRLEPLSTDTDRQLSDSKAIVAALDALIRRISREQVANHQFK